MKNKKSNLSKYLFVLGAFSLVLFLGFNSSTTDEKLTSENNQNLEQEDFSLTDKTIEEILSNNQDKVTEKADLKESKNIIADNDKDIENLNYDLAEDIINNEIFVNKIVIAKNIDNDSESNQYREPIDSYQTITTMHQGITKEINYHPSFFVWTSVNTENVNLTNEVGDIEPINLSLIVSCKDQEIQKIDYDVTASTPRWREWVEIDLTTFAEKTLDGNWNVKIINNDDQNILESRDFKLVTPEIKQQEATAELKIQF